MKWHAVPERLGSAYRVISARLGGSDFYLAGGTALALQIGHRVSIDLDLMSPTFEDPESLETRLREDGLEFETTMIARGTLYLDLDNVQVSLIAYKYPMLLPLVTAPDGLLPLASCDDIAAMKLAAIASRGSRKDFVDLWFLVNQHPPLRRYFDLFRQKYESRDIGHVVRSLTYFEDAEAEPGLHMLVEASWPKIKTDLLGWVRGLLDW